MTSPDQNYTSWHCECGDHVWAPTTKGFITLVSPEDGHYLDKKWWASQSGKGARASRSVPGGKSVMLHRVIMSATSEQMVDHKNLNALDNRRNNLRFCTKSQNAQNTRPLRGATIPYKGVFVDKRWNCIYAAIVVNGRKIYLGWFASAEEAAVAYERAAVKYFGEFARVA